MEVLEEKPSSSAGYSLGPPWSFKGSALYQLHLVKAETARAFIPKGFKLVEAFGYTLGGFFLAHYDDSPAAVFDELVVIAGLIWNPPTSCAWAARVIVNSDEACRHGRKAVGLPSHVGIFSKRDVKTRGTPISKFTRFLNMGGIGSHHVSKKHSEIQVLESRGASLLSLCSISIPYAVPHSENDKKWMGPTIRMSLPSFSGQTIHKPHLLKYSCQIECRLRAVVAAKISGPIEVNSTKFSDDDKFSDNNSVATLSDAEEKAWNGSISVMLSKPILALEFSHLKMQVEAPTIVVPRSYY